MPVRRSEAVWEGNLRDGSGRVKLGSGAFEGPYTYLSRFEEGAGTNPEELIAAAHAGCFSMALASNLAKAGYSPRRIRTAASVTLERTESGSAITHIQLDGEAEVPGIGQDEFAEIASMAKAGCPVSKALKAIPIDMNMKLVS